MENNDIQSITANCLLKCPFSNTELGPHHPPIAQALSQCLGELSQQRSGPLPQPVRPGLPLPVPRSCSRSFFGLSLVSASAATVFPRTVFTRHSFFITLPKGFPFSVLFYYYYFIFFSKRFPSQNKDATQELKSGKLSLSPVS